MYNLDWLKEKTKGEERIKYVFFWGHRLSKDGSIVKTCMSQWAEYGFEVDGVNYKTAEHWMMAEKARVFNDKEMWQRIVECKSAAEAKKLGRQVRNFNNTTWLKERFDIVKNGSIHKFGQNEKLKAFLLATGNRVLVEASPYDKIWGIGMKQDHPDADRPYCWKGLNLLGFALMAARDELREEK